MKLIIRKKPVLIRSRFDNIGGWVAMWRAWLEDPEWGYDVILVGDYISQSDALKYGCLAYKFSNTKIGQAWYEM